MNPNDSVVFPSLLSRRSLLQLASLPLAAQLCDVSSELQAADSYQPRNRFPRMVHNHFVRQVRRAERNNQLAAGKLETREDAEQYVASVRSRIRKCFGPVPERTPLNPRITGTIERDEYRIEKLIFESRPGMLVTANLYVPKNRDYPVPGVVGTCGHSANGKAAVAYQSFAQGLARQGYMCLIYDPIGQGERYQYVGEDLKPRMRSSVLEHLYAGNQQFLIGEFFGAWRAWDGIRALDYLLTRDEVDPHHVGVTGNSGGGTMTTWLCGVEQRWSMAAPSCFVTTFRRNMENELPADTEQCPPKALALNLDHADFLAAMAPKPVIVLAKERDYFDARGAEEAYQRLKTLYDLLGKPDQIAMYAGPTTHGYSQENREAMYGWFNRATDVSDQQTEPEITIEKDETLWCTPHGQVAELDSRTVFSFTRERSQQLTASRSSLSGKALHSAVRHVLKINPDRATSPDYRILRHWSSRGYPTPHGISYAVESDPDVFSIVYMLTKERWYSRPPQGQGRATLYVAHRSSDAELRDESLLRDLVKSDPDTPLFTCDVRGIGESQPDTCGTDSFDDPYGCDYFYAIHSLMLDRPYVGQKTFDVLCVLNWLARYGYHDVHLIGNGWGALPATFAALFSDHVQRVTLQHALTSYAAIAESEQYNWPLATLLPNVLQHFDLPDCYRALQPKGLRQIDPWDASASAS